MRRVSSIHLYLTLFPPLGIFTLSPSLFLLTPIFLSSLSRNIYPLPPYPRLPHLPSLGIFTLYPSLFLSVIPVFLTSPLGIFTLPSSSIPRSSSPPIFFLIPVFLTSLSRNIYPLLFLLTPCLPPLLLTLQSHRQSHYMLVHPDVHSSPVNNAAQCVLGRASRWMYQTVCCRRLDRNGSRR